MLDGNNTVTKALDNYVQIPLLANLFITYLILNRCSLDPQRPFRHNKQVVRVIKGEGNNTAHANGDTHS